MPSVSFKVQVNQSINQSINFSLALALSAHLLRITEGALDFLARVLGFLVKIDGLMRHLLHFHIESKGTFIDILNLGSKPVQFQ